MIFRAARLEVAISVSVIAIAVSFGLYGADGAAGMVLGLVGTALNLAAGYFMIGLAGHAIKGGLPRKGGNLFTVGLFFVKLPLLILLGFAAKSLGQQAFGCFLAGLGLVYLCLVGWALAKS